MYCHSEKPFLRKLCKDRWDLLLLLFVLLLLCKKHLHPHLKYQLSKTNLMLYVFVPRPTFSLSRFSDTNKLLANCTTGRELFSNLITNNTSKKQLKILGRTWGLTSGAIVYVYEFML